MNHVALVLTALVLTGLPAVPARAAEPATQAYRRLASLEEELAGLQRTLGEADVGTSAALARARQEVQIARQRHCRALYRARLVDARQALLEGQRTRAAASLAGARRLLVECPVDEPARSVGPPPRDDDALALR